MDAMARTRLVNPRLGTYFGIFASAFAAVVLMGLLLEQLGTRDSLLRLVFFAVPIALYAGFAARAFTNDRADFFTAGRRIPAAFNGLVTAITTLGGTGLIAITGVLFLIGVDGLVLSIGWISGLVVATVLLVPFLRKFGCYTIPSYFGRRFASRTVRVLSAAILSIPVLLLLAAEIRIAAATSAMLLGRAEALMVLIVTAIVALIAVSGGMRSLTWSSAAKGIAALLALVVPVTIVAILISTVPIPQLTHGTLLRSLTRLELTRGLPTLFATPLQFDMPGALLEPMGKRFLQSFGAIGPTSYVMAVLALMAGIAAMPSQLMRANVSPAVYEARKSMGWAVLITGFVFLTTASVAVYLRGLVLEQVIGANVDQLPLWFKAMQQTGMASINKASDIVTIANVTFRRDAMLFALPLAAGFPRALQYLSLAGGLAACLAAMTSALVCLGSMLAEDIVHGIHRDPPSDGARVVTARLAILAAAGGAAALALVPADPLHMALWALALSAAAGFPVLVLSILWKRINSWGATLGLVAGFGTAATILLTGEMASSGGALPVAAIAGMAASALSAIVASLVSAAPSRHVLELVRDMRTPGGETLYDRELRIARLKALKPV
jgi:cation/acetate symporter